MMGGTDGSAESQADSLLLLLLLIITIIIIIILVSPSKEATSHDTFLNS